jgi:hypothetical protein
MNSSAPLPQLVQPGFLFTEYKQENKKIFNQSINQSINQFLFKNAKKKNQWFELTDDECAITAEAARE